MRAEFDIYGIIDSLKLLAATPCARLFPASGSVVDDPASTLSAKIAYLEETGERVRRLHEQGYSETQLRQKVYCLAKTQG